MRDNKKKYIDHFCKVSNAKEICCGLSEKKIRLIDSKVAWNYFLHSIVNKYSRIYSEQN